MDERVCTCHPDDRPPVCQHRYGARECQDAYRSDTRLPYNSRYSRQVKLQLGDLERLLFALAAADDYFLWMTRVRGLTLPGNSDTVTSMVTEARKLGSDLFNANIPENW